MPVHSWFLRCRCSILLSPTWPHKMVSWPSPIYRDSWDKHSRFLSVLFFTASDFTFTTRHNHSYASLLFWPSHFPLFALIVIALLSSPVIKDTFSPGAFISQCPIFLPFHTVHGVARQECWSGLSFPPPVYHVFSELSITTCPSWVALHGMIHSFFELCKPLCHSKTVICEGVLDIWYEK